MKKSLCLLLAMLLCLSGCGRQVPYQRYSMSFFEYFDTIITITGYDDWMKVPTAGNNPPPATPVRKNLPEHRKENFRPIYQRFT